MTRLIIRVAPDAPPFSPGEPRSFTARSVDLKRKGVGKGLTVGAAIDDLLGTWPRELTVIVDHAAPVSTKQRAGKGLHSPMLKRLVKGLEDT